MWHWGHPEGLYFSQRTGFVPILLTTRLCNCVWSPSFDLLNQGRNPWATDPGGLVCCQTPETHPLPGVWHTHESSAEEGNTNQVLDYYTDKCFHGKCLFENKINWLTWRTSAIVLHACETPLIKMRRLNQSHFNGTFTFSLFHIMCINNILLYSIRLQTLRLYRYQLTLELISSVKWFFFFLLFQLHSVLPSPMW